MRLTCAAVVGAGLVFVAGGCCHPKITAVPLSAWNRDEPHGIPFYLPKPILIVAKNFRNVEEAKVGLTDSAPIPNYFDDQAKYADVNARTSFVPAGATSAGQAPAGTSGAATYPGGVSGTLATNSPPRVFSEKGAPLAPGAAPQDGLTPETFYTYQIVFIPDMTQKYGLKIRGGVGEIRAAMNLVNGWQFTGLGPYYMKDSSTAQNTISAGLAANLTSSGVADVISSVAGLRSGRGGRTEGDGADARQVQEVFERVEKLGPVGPPMRLDGFAEIHMYEPHLTCDGRMEWRPLVDLTFFRDYLGTSRDRVIRTRLGDQAPMPKADGQTEGAASKGKTEGAAVAAPGTAPVNVNQYCGPPGCGPVAPRGHPLLEKFLNLFHKRGRIVLSQDFREGEPGQVPLPPAMVTPPVLPTSLPTPAARPGGPTPAAGGSSGTGK